MIRLIAAAVVGVAGFATAGWMAYNMYANDDPDVLPLVTAGVGCIAAVAIANGEGQE